MIQKAQIVSDLFCYGPMPKPVDPIEQRLTISASGRVWFTEYLYGQGYPHKKPIGRRCQISIGKEKAAMLLNLLDDYRNSKPLLLPVTDVGTWDLLLTGTDGKKERLSCSMIGGVVSEGYDMTELIQKTIPIDDLRVFG